MNVFDDFSSNLNEYFTNITYKYQKSSKWKEYLLGIAKSHCWTCLKRSNKVYLATDVPLLPEHDRCVCFLEWLRKLSIGNATNFGQNGADYYLYYFGKLPDYYISKDKAYEMGWRPIFGNLNKVAPGKMIGGDVFGNRENKLPSAPGRVWFECDVDYNGGYRNNCRIIYSNDGLMFKTDSHYTSFISIE